MKRLLRGLGPNVIALGFTSFFTDLGSEMVFPLLPHFITATLKGSDAMLGLIEGAANSVSSLLRVISGWASDRVGRRKPFILAGYGLSALVRPCYAAVTLAGQVLALRVTDRLGKGLRLAPRDALIAASCDPAVRGKAFGFQHAMDSLGAALGPLLCFLMLRQGMELRPIFLLTALPAAMVLVVIAGFVRDVPPAAPVSGPPKLTLRPFDGRFKAFLAVVFLFALGNASDAFILHRAEKLGVALEFVPLVWVGMNLVRMATGLPAGILADRLGRRGVVLVGWTIYATCYAGFALSGTLAPFLVLAGLYAAWAAFGDSVARAIVADLVPGGLRATAYGMYHFCVGIAALPASLGFGWISGRWGAEWAFATGAVLAAAAALLLAGLRLQPRVDRIG